MENTFDSKFNTFMRLLSSSYQVEKVNIEIENSIRNVLVCSDLERDQSLSALDKFFFFFKDNIETQEGKNVEFRQNSKEIIMDCLIQSEFYEKH